MNKIKLMRQNPAICPVCKSPDYIYLGCACKAKWGKHEFKYNSCHYIWQYGKTDNVYLKFR